jgi:23S rRNA C2498 (ribose-2'-O)-methylase RlmM
MNEVLLYCRPGFERECAQDMVERSAICGVTGESTTTQGSGFVVFAASNRKQGNASATKRRRRFDFAGKLSSLRSISRDAAAGRLTLSMR